MASKLKPPLLLLIAGSTASGKSSLALELAERTGGVIVNADSSLSRSPGAQRGRRKRSSASPSIAFTAISIEPLLLPRQISGKSGAEDRRCAFRRADADPRLGGRDLTGTLLDGIVPVPSIDPQSASVPAKQLSRTIAPCWPNSTPTPPRD